jgi:hypothetical protein
MSVTQLRTWFDDPADNYWVKFGYSFGKSTTNTVTIPLFTYSLNIFIQNNGIPPNPLARGWN